MNNLGQFLHYQLEDDLAGNMAQVYRALDTLTSRQVILRRIRDLPEKKADIEAEERGVELQKRVSVIDSHVPKIYDYGKDGGYFYIVMEYIEGEDLTGKIRSASLSTELSAAYAIEICKVIETAQQQGIVHGDLKPPNIRITPRDEVKVLDFGIAKEITGGRKSTRNEFRSTEYASPERVDRGTMSVESDMWSVGIMLHEMVSGQKPFHAEKENELQRLILDYQKYNRSLQLPSLCPESLKRIILKSLAPQLDRRYSGPAELRADLERFLRAEKTTAELEATIIPDSAPTRRTSTPLPDNAATRKTPRPQTTVPPSTRPQPVTPKPTATPSIGAPTQPMTESISKPVGTKSYQPTTSYPAPTRNKKRWLLIAGIVLALLAGYLAINEYSVWSGMKTLAADLDQADSSEKVKQGCEVYKALAKRSWFGFGISPVRAALRSKLVERAKGELDRYRDSDTAQTVRGDNWHQAEECLRWARELGSDKDVEAMLCLSEGHLLRINKKYYEAVRKFEAAAQLKLNWPDPYIGLARVYTYNLKDRQKADDANRKMVELSGEDDRSKAMLADNCLNLAAELFKKSRGVKDQPDQEKNLLSDARSNCQKAADLYSLIITFGNASTSRDRAIRLCKQVDERMRQINEATSSGDN